MKTWGGRRRLRIKSKARLIISLLIISIVVILLVLLPLWNRGQAMTPVRWMTYHVATGDTLWEIAKQTLPDGIDIRDYIAQIKEANDLDGALLRAGQQLQIPLR